MKSYDWRVLLMLKCNVTHAAENKGLMELYVNPVVLSKRKDYFRIKSVEESLLKVKSLAPHWNTAGPSGWAGGAALLTQSASSTCWGLSHFPKTFSSVPGYSNTGHFVLGSYNSASSYFSPSDASRRWLQHWLRAMWKSKIWCVLLRSLCYSNYW